MCKVSKLGFPQKGLIQNCREAQLDCLDADKSGALNIDCELYLVDC